jgi:hypothetical protein
MSLVLRLRNPGQNKWNQKENCVQLHRDYHKMNKAACGLISVLDCVYKQGKQTFSFKNKNYGWQSDSSGRALAWQV